MIKLTKEKLTRAKDCKTCQYYGEFEKDYCEYYGEKIPTKKPFKCDKRKEV
jgi:hypothetical protein